jgi:hypothetical protein
LIFFLTSDVSPSSSSASGTRRLEFEQSSPTEFPRPLLKTPPVKDVMIGPAFDE